MREAIQEQAQGASTLWGLSCFFALQFHSFKSFQVIPIPALKGWNSL